MSSAAIIASAVETPARGCQGLLALSECEGLPVTLSAAQPFKTGNLRGIIGFGAAALFLFAGVASHYA
jgi:hypothetical protein